MKISKKERHLLIGLIGILAVVAVYFLITKPYTAKIDKIRKENKVLSEQAELYKQVNKDRQMYVDGIKAFEDEKASMISNFPSDIKVEDEIMFYANMQRQFEKQVALKDLAMNEAIEILPDGVEVAPAKKKAEEPVEEEGFDASVASQIHLQQLPINITYEATYDGLKSMIQYILTHADKKNILGLEASLDSSTGNIVGSIDIGMFYMNGIDKEYKPTTIPRVVTGNQNLYHSVGTTINAGSTTLDAPTEEDAETEDAE